MNEDQEVQPVQNPEFTKFLAEEQAKLEAETKFKLEEMDKQIAYSEKLALRELKKEAFRMAIQIKPQAGYNPMGGQNPTPSFTVEDLIKSANKIYEELIK